MASLLPLAFGRGWSIDSFEPAANVIGWLLMLPPLAVLLDPLIKFQLEGVTTPPASPSLFFLLAAYLSNAFWVLLIFPLFFIRVAFSDRQSAFTALALDCRLGSEYARVFCRGWGVCEGIYP